MADERDRVARDDQGNLFRLDATSGKWVAATGPDLQVIASGVRGDITAAIEGFIPITSVLESFGAVEPGFAKALGEINPTATAAGQAAGVGLLATSLPAAARFMGFGLGLVRATTGGVPRGTLTVQKLEQVAEKGRRAVPRADVGEFVPGTQPGVVGGTVRALGQTAQGFAEQSKLMTQVFQSFPVLRGITRNVQRQVFANFAGIRGTSLKAVDFGRDGKLVAGALNRNHKATNDLYRGVLDVARQNDSVKLSSLAQKRLLDAVKTIPKAERALVNRILPKKAVNQGEMTKQQVVQRHKEARALSKKTDNDIVRDALDEITNELELLMRGEGFNLGALREANEAWRFEQMLNASITESGQLNYATLINKAEKFFAREFGLEDVAGASVRDVTLSAKGQDAISTLLEIRRAGGVQLPSKAVSAVDWIVILTALGGGTLATAGVF